MKTRSNATNGHELRFRMAPLSMTSQLPEPAYERSASPVGVSAECDKRTVLINLNDVTSIDSGGIAHFMEAMQRIAAQGGNLVLFGIREEVRRIFETAKLDQVFQIFSTREEALADRGGIPRCSRTPAN